MIDVGTLPPMLSKAETAELAGVSISTIERRIKDGTFTSTKIGGTVRIPRDHLLIRLGLVSARSTRRDRKQAEAEAHAAAARWGGA